MESKKQNIIDTVSDLVGSFVYYDRKEDEDLSPEDLASCVKSGEITIDEIVEQFRTELQNAFKD